MIFHTKPCPSDALVGLLEAALSPGTTAEVTEHIGQCETCRRQLEQLAGAPQVWKEASLVLSDPGLRRNRQSEKEPEFSDAHRSSKHQQEQNYRLDALVPNLQPSTDPESLGRLDGYEVLGVIGFGGMGVVLRAFEPALNRPVAIKVLHPHLATNGAARRRFAREARAAAAVNHPSVVPIHAVNAEANPPYIVMGFITGGSLQDRIDREGPLEIGDVLRIGCQVADALFAAHAQGLVHRDVKPGNILLDHGQDRVLLSDFGLAQALDDASLTASGMIAGTPQYMSPEQARGETVDARSDLFSLGGVLYAMTTGRPPFRGDSTLAILNKIGREPVRSVCEIQPEVPEWIGRLIDRLLSKDLADRPQSADEVSQLLRECLSYLRSPTSAMLPELLAPVKPAKPSKPSETLRTRSSKNMVAAIICCGLAVSIPVSIVAMRWLQSEQAQNTTERNTTELNSGDPLQQPMLFWNDGLDDDFQQLEETMDSMLIQ